MKYVTKEMYINAWLNHSQFQFMKDFCLSLDVELVYEYIVFLRGRPSWPKVRETEGPRDRKWERVRETEGPGDRRFARPKVRETEGPGDRRSARPQVIYETQTSMCIQWMQKNKKKKTVKFG